MSPKQAPNKPIDIYCRVSRVAGRDGDSFQSLEQQEQRCRAQLAADGLTVGNVFTDTDQSGGKTSRPQFDKVLERARSGASGGIVVHDLTRFGRYATMAEDIIALEEAGALFISCAEKIDTSSSSGRAFLRIMGAFATMYREEVGDRLIVSKQGAVARGIHVSKFVPTGYVKGADGKLEPHPVHGPTVAEAYRMAANGSTPSEIAAFLNERGLPSGANQKPVWRSGRIRRLLANPAYRGQARAGSGIVLEGAHEALVDDILWRQAQRERKGSRPQPTASYLLAGIARCASCRYSMKAQGATKHSKPVYRCAAASSTGRCTCPTAITMEHLDRIVLDAFVARTLGSPDSERVAPEDPELRAAMREAELNLEKAKSLDLPDEIRAAAVESAEQLVWEAQEALAQGPTQAWDEHDAARLANAALPLLDANYELDEAGTQTVRAALARDIQAVFVRPPVKGEPIENRVAIVWADEPAVELPKRGSRFEPRPYTWDEEPQEVVA